MDRARLYRRLILITSACAWLFVFLSAASFHATDWPSPAVYPYGPAQNLCGPAGALVAYALIYVIGPGVFPILLFAAACIAFAMTGRRITDLTLRLIGIAILALTIAASARMISPGSYSSLPEGHGGILGIAAAGFLATHCSRLAVSLTLACSFLVGLLLTADDLVLRSGELLRAAWNKYQSRRSRLRASPVLAGIPNSPQMDEDDEPLKPPVLLERQSPKPIRMDEDDEPAAEEETPAPAPVPPKDIVVKLPATLKPRQSSPPPVPKELGDYQLPPWNLLADAEYGFAQSQEAFVREMAAVLEQALKEFQIDARVVEIDTGPVITMYEISLAPGIKVSKITELSNDIMRALRAESVRIVAPVPGKNTVGIEVPNAQKEKVRLKELMQLAPDATAKQTLPLFLGKDASGEPLVSDLAAMPHCLIAGTTGSGKSVCINGIIMSILYKQRPDMVKLILVDPKMVEMAAFKDVPHLLCPIINDTARATSVLDWACQKMDERYEILAEAGVRNIKGYNALTRDELLDRFQPASDEEAAKIPKQMPYIVILIDELADLMMTSGREVEEFVVRLAQKSRSVGIHLILATQRPQANVVTGLIKSNMPARIAFRVSSRMDSRIVLDQNGADVLLGGGDMLFLPPGNSKPIRAQGTFVDDKEIRESVKLVRGLAKAQYEPELIQIQGGGPGLDDGEKDDLFDDAVRIVLETKRGSVSLLQRRLTIGYGRASRLIEQMARAGIVGAYKGTVAREAAITVEEWEAMKAAEAKDAQDGMTV